MSRGFKGEPGNLLGQLFALAINNPELRTLEALALRVDQSAGQLRKYITASPGKHPAYEVETERNYIDFCRKLLNVRLSKNGLKHFLNQEPDKGLNSIANFEEYVRKLICENGSLFTESNDPLAGEGRISLLGTNNWSNARGDEGTFGGEMSSAFLHKRFIGYSWDDFKSNHRDSDQMFLGNLAVRKYKVEKLEKSEDKSLFFKGIYYSSKYNNDEPTGEFRIIANSGRSKCVILNEYSGGENGRPDPVFYLHWAIAPNSRATYMFGIGLFYSPTSLSIQAKKIVLIDTFNDELWKIEAEGWTAHMIPEKKKEKLSKIFFAGNTKILYQLDEASKPNVPPNINIYDIDPNTNLEIESYVDDIVKIDKNLNI